MIQFPHPGFEYPLKGDEGIMPWKEEGTEHNRKYLVVPGAVVDPETMKRRDNVNLGFWGEWEAPSYWRRRIHGRAEDYHPTFFHQPLLPAERPTSSHQNTDPIVFGDSFGYSNCKQYKKAMKEMPHGSLVLFGRGMKIHGERRFVLDTCFVVNHGTPTRVARDATQPWGESLLHDMVLGPFTPVDDHEWHLTDYRALMHSPGMTDFFSFFPAVVDDAMPEGFARPVLRPNGALRGRLTETLMMGIKPTTLADLDEAHAVWHEVVRQVQAQGCQLGVYAEPPQRGSLEVKETELRADKTPGESTTPARHPRTVQRREGRAQPHSGPTEPGSPKPSIPQGTVVAGKRGLLSLLRDWLSTGEPTVGDAAFKGRAWIHIDLGTTKVVLNADTKREAVQAFVDHASTLGIDAGWAVIPTGRSGKIIKVTFASGTEPVPGWYAYTTHPQPSGTVL